MQNVEITNISHCEECLRHFKPNETVVYATEDHIVVCAQCSNRTHRLRQQPIRLKLFIGKTMKGASAERN